MHWNDVVHEQKSYSIDILKDCKQCIEMMWIIHKEGVNLMLYKMSIVQWNKCKTYSWKNVLQIMHKDNVNNEGKICKL